ncbi:MAG: pyridoxamine 5'-phosphate oxidase family protein [Haliea sp.]|nr:pyridoxamine 5'-phosphate oxidase family protein [Haliea sp.]
MTLITPQEKDAFFRDVEAAAKKSIWCALATVTANHEARVRMVHPTWEGDILWIATGPQTAKAREIRNNGAVDIQFQVAPDDFVHLLVRGEASVYRRHKHRAAVGRCQAGQPGTYQSSGIPRRSIKRATPRSMRYSTHKPTITTITQASGMPMRVSTSTAPSSNHSKANHKGAYLPAEV